jgi:hypothetical protein
MKIIQFIIISLCLCFNSSYSDVIADILKWRIYPGININIEIGYTFGKYHGFNAAIKNSVLLVSNPLVYKDNIYFGYNFINADILLFKLKPILMRSNGIVFGYFGGADNNKYPFQFAGFEVGKIHKDNVLINKDHLYIDGEFGTLIYGGINFNITDDKNKYQKIKIGINIPYLLIVLGVLLKR